MKQIKRTLSAVLTLAILASALTACGLLRPQEDDIFEQFRERNQQARDEVREEGRERPHEPTLEIPTPFEFPTDLPPLPPVKVGTIEQINTSAIQYDIDIWKFHTDEFLWRIVKSTPNGEEYREGIIDARTGKVIIEPIYANIEPFCELGFARVSTEGELHPEGWRYSGLWGVVDKKGALVIPAKYTTLGQFDPVHKLAMAGINPRKMGDEDDEDFNYQDTRYGFINTRGDVIIPLQFDSVGWGGFGDGSAGLAPVGQSYGECCCDTKWGYVNTRGVMVIPFMYDQATPFIDGLARVSNHREGGGTWLINAKGEVVVARGNNDWSWWNGFDKETGLAVGSDSTVIDTHGKTVFSIDHGRLSGNQSEGMFFVRGWNDRCGFVNSRGETVASNVYLSMHEFFRDSLMGVAVGTSWDNHKSGFVDTNGRLVIPAIYDEVGSFSNGFAPVYKDGKWGIINTRGDIVIPIEHDYIENAWGDREAVVNGVAIVRRPGSNWGDNHSIGLIDMNGNVVLPYEFASILFVGKDESTGRAYYWANIGKHDTPRWRIYAVNPA